MNGVNGSPSLAATLTPDAEAALIALHSVAAAGKEPSTQRFRPGGPGGRAPRSARSAASLDTKHKTVSHSKHHDKVFPPITTTRRDWVRQTARALEAEARQLQAGKTRNSTLRKAISFPLCGSRTRVRECNACGSKRPGSGVQIAPGGGYPCNLRICSICQRRAAQKKRSEYRLLLEKTEVCPGHSYKHVTLTSRYDPRDPSDVSVAALKRAVEGLRAAVAALWKNGLRQTGAGLVYGIECGLTGNVHLHILYLGPFLNKKWLESTAAAAFDRSGHSWIRQVANDDTKIVVEIAKYTSKGPSPLAEEWFHTAREVMSPELAARWEIATLGAHLHDRRGVFRKLPRKEEKCSDEHASLPADENPADAKMPCPTCKQVAGYRDVIVDTNEWVSACHARGYPAFNKAQAPPSDEAWASENTKALAKAGVGLEVWEV